jgi:Subtilase family
MSLVGGEGLAGRVPDGYRDRAVIKFKPGIRFSYDQAADAEHAKAHGEAWNALRARFADVRLQPYFTCVEAAEVHSFERRAAAVGADPRLTSYFTIEIPAGATGAAVVETIAAWPHVETAYLEGGPVPPPVNPSDDPLSASQGYLAAAPAGIDAIFAWTQTDGSGVGLVDLEQGWTLDHEDLPPNIGVLGSGEAVDPWPVHGTAVLGIVAAADNDKGVVGIAPAVNVRVVSQWFPPFFNTPGAILTALINMQPGDVLLIETTAPPDPLLGWVPADVVPANFDLISAGTSLGIVILEPAGNNLIGSNLDVFKDTNGKSVLNRATPDFKDSGAIIVGAATSAAPHQRAGFSNFGSRVDCYAWGENIATCGGDLPIDPNASPQQSYTLKFGGCSGATAIVAGAAVLLQSWRLKHQGTVYDPATLRELLSNLALNTPSKTPLNDRIGVMPNLRKIIAHETVGSFGHLHDRWLLVIYILFGVIQDGGGLGWQPGRGPVPIDPWGPLLLAPEKRDVLVGLALSELASLAGSETSRKLVEDAGVAVMRGALERIEETIKARRE